MRLVLRSVSVTFSILCIYMVLFFNLQTPFQFGLSQHEAAILNQERFLHQRPSPVPGQCLETFLVVVDGDRGKGECHRHRVGGGWTSCCAQHGPRSEEFSAPNANSVHTRKALVKLRGPVVNLKDKNTADPLFPQFLDILDIL